MSEQPSVIMYGTASCPYCMAARMLFKKKSVDFEEISVAGDALLRQEMEQLSGGQTVPQIFINGKPVGGFDDVYALDQQGELDKLLGRA
jgi:glutaredoxin 3